VAALSAWLAEDGSDKGDDIVLGSVTMPDYVEALRLHLAQTGTWNRYTQWRDEWPQLDRHQIANQRERTDTFLAMAR
jgi:hypothetical protein